ncbi:Uncharacterized protein FWK35_00030980, partial [Aphis craccivora]
MFISINKLLKPDHFMYEDYTDFTVFIFVLDQIIIYFRKTDSERSEECIDFTMIITSRNNAPISNYGGGFRCKSEYPWCIIE